MNPYCIDQNKKFENDSWANSEEFLIFEGNFESANVDIVIKVSFVYDNL